MIRTKRGMTITAGAALAAIIAVVAILSWNAGGPQELHEITQPVAVPELPR